MTPEQAFLRRVNKTDTCWFWTGDSIHGYGRVKRYNKDGTRTSIRAHRLAYMLWVNEDISGSVIHHRCANRACVNPAHLQKTTSLDNTAEMFQRQHYIKAIARLTAELKKVRKELDKHVKA